MVVEVHMLDEGRDADAKDTVGKGLAGRAFDLSGIRGAPEVIWPEEAQTHLAGCSQPTNAERAGVLVSYVNAMAQDRWRMNGDPIVFDEDERLVSGRLRMWACVMSGKPFTTIVVRGVPREARATMGSHLQRTTRDMMSVNGEVYATEITAGWPIVLGYMRSRDTRLFSVHRKRSLGFFEIEGLTERYPAMRETARFVRDVGAVPLMGPGMVTAAHYLMSLVDRDSADAFVRQFADPSLDPNGAGAALAAKLADPTNKRSSQAWRLAIVIKAWNASRAGIPVRPEALRYQDKRIGGRPPETFPTIAGLAPDASVDMSDLPGGAITSAPADEVFFQCGSVRVRIMTFDTKAALDLLSRNGPVGGNGNRKLRDTHVKSLARDMEAGAWIFNGQPIKIAISGRLIDGQHRLSACVASGVPFQTLVVEGLDDEVFTTFDTGQRLGLAAVLRDAGYADGVTLAASIALLVKVYGLGWRTPTSHEGLAFLADHPELVASVAASSSNGMATRTPRSLLSALDYLVGEVEREAADAFMGSLSTGADIRAGTALLVLREYLNNKGHTRPVTERLLRVSMNAWNGHRKGVVPYRIEEAGNFPELI